MRVASLALVALATGCAEPRPEIEPVAKTFAAMDLISPATCFYSNGKLKKCVIGSLAHETALIDTAVPLRTVVRRVKSGNCSTPYSLAVAARVDDGAESKLYFLSEASVVLRRPDGQPVTTVGVRDASTFTPYAVFDGSCRVSLEIDVNEVDVDTVQQAEAILAAIDQEIAAAETDRKNYEQLLALQAAYTFTRAVAESFHAELTSETMQTLRQAAIDAAPAMEVAALGCGDALSDEQRDTLFELYVSLVVLGDPAAWQNPDGSTKTLEQFYGPGAAAVLAQLEALAANSNPDLEAQYQQGLEAAAAEVIRLQQKRALAVEQLAPWIGGES